MCCAGCLSVAKTISDASLTQYYQIREITFRKRAQLSKLSDFSWFDKSDFQKSFVSFDRQGNHQANFIIEPIDCPACVWLIEKRLGSIKGVQKIQMDAISGRLHLVWKTIQLSEIAESLAQIGYALTPEKPNDALLRTKALAKKAAFGFFVGALCAMQAMMFALPVYLDHDHTMINEMRLFFEAATMCFALISILLVAKDWIISALSDIKTRALTMNLSLSAAILLLFVASMINFFKKTGDIYFDSITMLIAFVALARWIQASINHQIESLRSGFIFNTLALVLRYTGDGVTTEYLPVNQLQVGDRLKLDRCDTLMVDARLLSEKASLDETMRTGESLPVHKVSGDLLLSGSKNLGEAVDVEVLARAEQSWMGRIGRMLSGAGDQKPRIMETTDKIASMLLPALLLMTVLTFMGWYWQQNIHQAWLSALAVFVVVCPCALALSVPLALSAAQAALLKQGIVVNHQSALERLPDITDMAFDKTGTLTRGELRLIKWVNLSNHPDNMMITLAKNMSVSRIHPVEMAFGQMKPDTEAAIQIASLISHTGKGTQADWCLDDQRHLVRLGALDFVDEKGVFSDHITANLGDRCEYTVYLGDDHQLFAVFYFEDSVRPGCHQMLLDNADKTHHILSGDHQETVDCVADELGIDDRLARMVPEDKWHIIQQWQKSGKKVMMMGDGINDALVMAAADVSVSFTNAATLTKNQADILFVQDNLQSVTVLMQKAKKTFLIIRQNIGWAVGYHIIMLPLAVLGYVTPWLAGIGMAVSSMLVCLNSARLLKEK